MSFLAEPARASWAWEAVTPSTYPDVGSAESYNGSIYMIGAWVQVYDPGTDSWTVRRSAATGYRGGSTIIGDRIYIVDSWTNALYYNISTDSFIDVINPPTTRLDYAVAQVGGILYVLGGWLSGDTTSINVVEAYNPANNSWWAVAPMLVGRKDFQAVDLGGYVYAISGLTGVGFVNPTSAVERYDPATNTWILVSSTNGAYRSFGATVHRGKIVVGGSMFSEVYLPESDLWVVGPPISIGNYFDNELASAGDYVYTVGGRTAPGATYNTTMRWDLKEPTPPSVAATDSPDPQIPGGTVWFNATALDNRGVASVWIRISYPNGSDMGNYSMTFNGAGGDWEYDAPFSGLGTYGYDVWAEDVSENWASFSGTFRIASSPDTQPPLVTNNRLNGSSSKTVVRGELVTVTAEVDDSTTGNSRIIEAWFTVDGGPSVRLFPTDGAFDSPTENVNATIDTSGWAVGAHAVCEFGKDEANNVGSVTSCNTLTVTVPAVNSPPVAAIAVTPSTTGFVDDVFTFNGSASSDPDGSIASWRWDFGDGFNAVGANVTHAFVAKLTFTVKLNVTDNLGAWDEATVQIVIVNRAPIIVMVSPGDSPVSLWAGNTQAFEVAAVDPDGDMLTYVWRVDGLAEGGDSPFYNFSRNGVRTYRVNITVSDGSAEAWHEWSVEVTSASPHVESGLPVWLIPAIVIIVAAIAIVLFVLWRRRRRAEGVTEEVLERRENGV